MSTNRETSSDNCFARSAANWSRSHGKRMIVRSGAYLTRDQIRAKIVSAGGVRLGVDSVGREIWVDPETRGGGIYSATGRGWVLVID